MIMKPDDWFEQLKAAYPKRSKGKCYGWPDAFKKIQLHFRDGHSFETILQGTKDYCAASKLSGDYGTEFIKQASTFYGPQLCFLDEYELEEAVPEVKYRKPEELTEEQRKRDAEKAVAQMAAYRARK